MKEVMLDLVLSCANISVGGKLIGESSIVTFNFKQEFLVK